MTDSKNHKSSGYAEIEVNPGVDRRKFLGLLGASMALAGATTTGCIRRPKEYIYPEVTRPENTIPGVAKFYSTSALIGGSVLGLSVTSTDGRPTKIDGNMRHPMSNPIEGSRLGSSNSFAQAEILNLYDPLRGHNCLVKGSKSNKTDTLKAVQAQLTALKGNQGQGLAVLFASSASPSFVQKLDDFQKAFPNALFFDQDTTYSQNRHQGLAAVAAQDADVVYDLSKATTILAVDSDFLGLEGDSVKNARQFAENRRVVDSESQMNRLYSVESNMSMTGSTADHRYTLPSALYGEFLITLAKQLSLNSVSLSQGLAEKLSVQAKLTDEMQKWTNAVAKDLSLQGGRAVVIVGNRLPAWMHELAFAINLALGAVKEQVCSLIPRHGNLKFVKPMSALKDVGSQIHAVVVVGGNPVYSQPKELGLKSILSKANFSVYLGFQPDETASVCQYYIPQSHFLECWGDTIATDGTYALSQPLIAPLFDDCMSELEFLSFCSHAQPQSDYDIVRATFQSFEGSHSDVESAWRQSLSDGVVASYAKSKPLVGPFSFENLKTQIEKRAPVTLPSAERLHLEFVLDKTIYDGRYGNVTWLQELPDPITKLVWDNALFMSPKTAKALGVRGNPKPGTSAVDVLKVSYLGRSVEAAVWEVPGIADFTLVFPLGYGRKFGEVAKGAGFNANTIRPSTSWMTTEFSIAKTGRTYSLVASQEHSSMNGTPTLKQDRPPAVREATLAGFRKKPDFVSEHELLEVSEQRSNLFSYPKNPAQEKWARQQWGMAIDLNTCIGCSACTVACQAENNISVVGKEEVFKNREMSWMRIDRYFNGNVDSPDVQTVYQPMNCQMCENAPCEAVCPVAATAHSPDGLNDMAYNRCVGTRYCANNCPYKVRRYNFFNYSKIDDERNPLYAMQKNPNVTVRFRGVMEKCTYCVQRINEAKIKYNKLSADGKVPDGAIVTACQSVCPTNSIVFGDVADPKTLVSRLKAQTRNYSLLGELNTKPRTTYLAKIRNVNPEIG